MNTKTTVLSKILHWIDSFRLHPAYHVHVKPSLAPLGALLMISSLLLSACSSLVPAATAVPTLPPATDTAVPTATTAPTDTQAAAIKPSGLDPCQLISSAEASKLTGATFGQGTEGTIAGGVNSCTYGAQATNLFFVEVIQAADKATADKAEKDFLDTLNANVQNLTNQGLTVTQIPTFADGAVYADASITAMGTQVDGSAFAFRKGNIFFGFSDVVIGGVAPTQALAQAEAQTVLGRLP